jgi:hypothetical protein
LRIRLAHRGDDTMRKKAIEIIKNAARIQDSELLEHCLISKLKNTKHLLIF